MKGATLANKFRCDTALTCVPDADDVLRSIESARVGQSFMELGFVSSL